MVRTWRLVSVAATRYGARSTAEGSAVRCPEQLAAGFLGGVNVTTLARHRLTRPLILRVANRMTPGAYASELIDAPSGPCCCPALSSTRTALPVLPP
jgi:hypothetical protein